MRLFWFPHTCVPKVTALRDMKWTLSMSMACLETDTKSLSNILLANTITESAHT